MMCRASALPRIFPLFFFKDPSERRVGVNVSESGSGCEEKIHAQN